MIETPKLSVDVIIRLWDVDEVRGIILIERSNPPLGLALPGGFVDVGETVEAAAVREMEEETSLEVVLCGLQGVYSDPHRDPRFHTVSVVFVGDSRGEPRPQSDARAIHVFAIEDLPFDRLVFDHARILRDFVADFSGVPRVESEPPFGGGAATCRGSG